MIDSTTHHIRPAGRHILTIGRDLIKDSYAAIVELVKNSYDADATKVDISFSCVDKTTKIIISDDGHGMDYTTVTTKWLVPSTNDKLQRRKSPDGRLMQGRKGIGRYAAAILGNEMLLTTHHDGQKTSILINWNDFENHQYLDEVELLVETAESSNPNGTIIEITDIKKQATWTDNEIKSLIKELRRLLSPSFKEGGGFDIHLHFEDFGIESYSDRTIKIEPFPVLELYDYKLEGKIFLETFGKLDDYPIDKSQLIHHKKDKSFDEKVIIADMYYENIAVKGKKRFTEIISSDISGYCGQISFDLRVYDREPDAIDSLIQRGLKDPDSGDFVTKTEARNVLNETCGIGIYRGDFRIRPHGDPGYDWLELDKQRVQDPSKKIGNNQIVGFITIENEERSQLCEKSARDGLKENTHYISFKSMIQRCLSVLEDNRFEYRKRTGKGRYYSKIESEFQKLFNFETLEKKIKKEFSKYKVPEKELRKVSTIIKDEVDKKNEVLIKIKETVAKYEGQVTLGKIIMVLMHEGRKPLSFFRDYVPRVEEHINYLRERYDRNYLILILDDLEKFEKNGDILIHLFDKIDPLAIRRRRKKKEFALNRMLKSAFDVFQAELDMKWITHEINCDENIRAYGWEQDYYIIFTNLIENSIYWLSDKKSTKNKITINVIDESDSLSIDYRDNGPGIKKEFIENQVIFEPGFTTKPDGSGLGLAITGEALSRNSGRIKAIYSEAGAYFRMEIDKKRWSDESNV